MVYINNIIFIIYICFFPEFYLKLFQISLGICRICHCNPETLPELGSLLSLCNCRGTVALVHMTCLERWLAESDSSSCELCRFQYNVERIPKHGPLESILIWINEVADFNQVIHLT